MTRGKFITLEGGEGAGKSTQATRLAERLRALGHEVVQTREPGGSPGAEALRELLVRGEAGRWSPVAEALLMYAARSDHLERVIRPALERGAWVVCDRFSDSSRAYQGAGGGVPSSVIESIDQAVVGLDQPDLTLIFDLPVEIGLERAHVRGGDARFESKGREFHERLRAGYLEIARAAPDRCVVLDAVATPEQVAERAWKAVEDRLLSADSVDRRLG
ncbi:MAG: dTMP kinase [Proteobacteria bacterium]|nr:dTMP kinase [Pseudomonadota bacterium]